MSAEHPMRQYARENPKGMAAHMADLRNRRTSKGKPVTITPQAREAAAKAGETMAGGRYPIRNAQDLGNAYKDWIRTGRPSDVAAWIAKRAKALGLPNPIKPTSEQDVARAFIAKRSSKN